MPHEHCNIAMFVTGDLISLNALVEAVTKQWDMPKILKTIRILFDSLFLERQAHNDNQDVTVTTLVADDDVWVASPGKYA